ncbi:MAG: hypothetical protein IJB47_03570, partial [Oscillospiraceae bacterium]|nr:hypothetical protein [Oscillospiraceae bacterium]
VIPTWLPSDFNQYGAYALGIGYEGIVYKCGTFGGVWVSDGNGGTVQIGDESGYYINCNKSGFVHDFDEICGGTCSDCGVTYYVVHTMGTAATCTELAVCSVCGESYGEVGGHTPAEDATYTDNGDGTHSYICTVCKETVTEDHTGGTATCTTLAVCESCGKEYGELAAHTPDANGKCTAENCGYQYAAKVGDTFYETIHKALRATEGINGCTLTLLDDVTLTSTSSYASYVNTGTFTLDLNGKTLSSNKRTLEVMGSADLTIRDSIGGGKIVSTGGSAVYLSGGKLTIESGIFEGSLDGVFLSGSSTLTVKGGTFTGSRAMITGFGSDCVIDLINIDPSGLTLKNNGSGTFAPKLPEGYGMVGSDGKLLSSLSAEQSATVHKHEYKYTDLGDGNHQQACSCGLTTGEPAAHSTTAEDDKAATCVAPAYCSVCDSEYGDVDKTNHDETVTYENGFCPNCDAYQSAALNAEGFYEIFNAGQLYWFARQVNIAGDTAANGKLMADIDLKNRTWYPIGLYDDIAEANGSPVQKQYAGTFDGNNHTVSNFTAIGNGSQGLFGYCNQTQTQIKNLGVINATVSGWNAGAVAGYCANLTNCYAVGCTITGASDTNTQAVTISSVGGNNGATVITNCWAYNCKLIVGEGEANYVMHPVGGIRASNDSVNIVQNCYYGEIVTVATFTSTTGATEKTEAQFASGEVAYLLGSPFGQTIGTHSLPVLYGETVYYGYTSCADNAVIGYTNDPNASAEKPDHSTTAANDKAANCGSKAYCSVCESYYGEVDKTNHDETVAYENGFCPNGCYEPAVLNGEVYEISNAGQLYWFAQQVNSGETTISAILMNDIVINSQVLEADGNLISDTSGLRQWTPIGHYNSDTDNLGFTGTFDGNGKTISGLYHYGDSARYAGLFGYSTGTIRDLTIADAYIHTTHSDGRAGSVAGLNYGTVSNCHNSGFVGGVNQGGGIVGRMNEGSVENCTNYGTVSGNYHVGGIAGFVSDGIINNCYNIGSVEATVERAGGIAGTAQSTSTISNCFSSGTVKGSSRVGGVVGFVANDSSTNVKITNCYYDNLIYSGNAVGQNGGSNGSGTLTKVEGKTTEQFTSGEITWLLNGESAEGIWKQTLDTDTYPSFTGDTVYCGYSNGCFEDAKFYTNNPEEATERADHTFDNGVCTVCGAYEPAADSDADGYYEIYNAGNLFWFAQKVNSGENTINAKLMADIDLENRAWTPMGTHDDTNSAKNCHFKGTFDGNYHIVKNLSVTVEDNCEAGFFGRAEGATIQNFGIVNARVEGKGGYRVGVIGGELHNCTVTNVFSAGEITLITDNAQKGGIAGESHSSTLNGCFTTYSNLTAAANVTVTNCYYLAEEASSASAGMNMSANKFASGELTWLLNGESAEGIWKQTLDTDTYPSFTGGTVYHGNCGGGVPYSNVAEETMNHTYNAENGYRCSNTLLSGGICNIYESAAQNADGYYEIYNASQLYWFAEQVNGGQKSINAVLMNDIDLTNHTWTPIGVTAMGEGVTDGYTGTFDGQGHVISNITFAAPTSAMAAGIFGTVQSGGTVKNLGVENLTFDNNDYDHRAAGIAGQLLADSTISDCYVINSTVKASSRVVGGIVGMNKGTVKNCYTCNMILAGYNNRFGGISGDYSGGKLENCYTDYSALASSEAGTTTNCEAGVSAERFASGEIAYALGNGWGQTIGTDGCPVFGGATVYQVANIGCPAQGEYVYSNVNEAVAAAHKYTNGFCACGEYEEAVQNADGYYVIDNAGKLFWFAELVNGGNNTINAVLTADIDLENRNWTPIGTQNESVSPNVKVPYMGVFDGQCHVIKNLSIHVTDGREAGLFGRAQDATLLNFGVVDAAVVSDPVNGTGYRAGIVAGELHRCTVTNVYSAGNLTVTTTHAQAGGIAGECADSTLTNCFTTYDCLTASNAALPAAVTNCYYLAESENTGSCGDYKTADQFASGEVAWLLNGSTDQGDLVWYQNIGMDAYPKFEGCVVNYNTESDTYHNGNTVSVSISWTEMSFTYTAGEWDPETHTYTGNWTADDGAAQITVKNVGAANVPVRFTFAGTMGEVTGQFDVEKAALAPGRAVTTTLTVSGDPQKSGFVGEQIGTVTVSLGGSGWAAGDSVTFYAKDGKAYEATVGEVTDSKLVLVSDNHKTKKINGRQCSDDVVLSL